MPGYLIPSTLPDLADVSSVDPQPGHILVRDTAGQYANTEFSLLATDFTGASVQTALNALPATPVGGSPYNYRQGGEVLLPAGTYRLSKPLLLQKTGMTLRGAVASNGAPATVLKTTGDTTGEWYGHLIYVGPAGNTLPTTTALATGAGLAMDLTTCAGGRYLSLRDVMPCDRMNGMTAGTVEFYFKPADVSTAGSLVQSQGRRFLPEGLRYGWSIYQAAAGNIVVNMTFSGGTIQLNSGASTLTNGTTVHVLCAFGGGTASLFLGGVLKDSQPYTGTLVQTDSMDYTVGLAILDWPEMTVSLPAATGVLDSLRISNSARHTSGFTPPTAKLTTDANTLLLVNFDNQQDLFTVGTSGATSIPCWLATRAINSAVEIAYVTICDLNILHGYTWGPFCVNAIFTCIRNLNLTCHGRGLMLWFNTYLSSVEDVSIRGDGTREGMILAVAAFSMRVRNANFDGFAYQVVLGAGSGSIHNLFTANETGSIIPLVIKGREGGACQWSIHDFATDDEPGSSVLEACVALDDGNQILFTNASLQADASAHIPPVVIYGGDHITFINCLWRVQADTPACVTYVSPPSVPVTLLGCSQEDTNIPLSIGVPFTPHTLGGKTRLSAADLNWDGTTLTVAPGGTPVCYVNRGSAGRTESQIFADLPASNVFALYGPGTYFAGGKDFRFVWSNDDTWFGTLDTSLSRVAANVLGVGRGAASGAGGFKLESKAGDPTNTDIPTNSWMVWKNTSSGVVKLWCNNAGSMVGIALA